MDRKRILRNPLVWILAAILIYFTFSVLFDDTRGYTAVPTSVALDQISQGNVKEALVEDREQRIRLDLTQPLNGSDKILTQYPAQTGGEIVKALQAAPNKPQFNTAVRQDSFLVTMLIYLIPLGIVLLILFWMMNNAQGGGNRVMSFGKSKAKQLNKDMPKTTFGDVAGVDEAVEELYEIKDFLQNPGRYQALGAKIPKGVLLYGPPGTGKTLLARAVAGEAGVPFYTISGSDFVEMFVGVGASRVRDLFEQAKQNSPCIIFVDEIDAVGRQRGAGLGGGHDEREQTLNQLLVEMDGFDARGGIILIAATNRPDILDPALLRPGRFDRQIPVGAPDLAGRRAVLAVHSKGKPFAPDVSFEGLAKRTVGMSGADLANVINEAALLTAREHGTLITEAALEESVDRVVGGPRRKGKIISERERKITAYHEGGHALAAWAMPDLEPVYKLTILPRGRTGGHALVVPEDDKGLMTRSEMIGRLVFAMGGRSAEELVFHEPTTGASSDIDQATKIARAMVTEYGMSARLGAVRYGREQGDPFLGRSMGNQADYSLEVAHEIDEEVRKLIEAAHTEAWEILNTYRDILDELVFELLEKETLTRKDLERIFDKVEKRPRITAFNDFGGRTPSDKPPIQSPAELAKERGEPWPPAIEPVPEPTPVGSFPGGGNGSVPAPGSNGHNGVPAQDSRPNAVPHNYGAPPDWRPATTPSGQTWPPPSSEGQNQWSKPAPGTGPGPVTGPGSPWAAPGNGHPEHRENGSDEGRLALSESISAATVDSTPGIDRPRAEAAIRELLIAVGEDPDREGLRDTPARVARAYEEIFAGLYTEPDTVLEKTFDEHHQELILVKDIAMFSTCEHHLVPFHGHAHVGYIPNVDGKVTGLSKIARVVDLYARRPQVQERLTAQVADALVRKLNPRGVIVVMEAEHLCMGMRGIRKPGSRTTTSAVRGLFQTSPSSRAEALALIRGT